MQSATNSKCPRDVRYDRVNQIERVCDENHWGRKHFLRHPSPSVGGMSLIMKADDKALGEKVNINYPSALNTELPSHSASSEKTTAPWFRALSITTALNVPLKAACVESSDSIINQGKSGEQRWTDKDITHKKKKKKKEKTKKKNKQKKK